MKIVVIGLNHKTAPIEIRERLSFNPAQAEDFLTLLGQRFPTEEFVLLSTCNRVEIYTVSDRDGWGSGREIIASLAEVKDLPAASFATHLYQYTGAEAVTHLFKVTSGLDSMIVGENQIIGQVKDAYKLACHVKTSGKTLNRLFHSAFTTSKEVHTTTEIASGRVSVAGVAIELAQQLFEHIEQARVVIIGAGQMGQLLVKHLLHSGCNAITVVNRSWCRARGMAEQFGIEAASWEALEDHLVSADIVIGSAAVADCLFDKPAFRPIVRRRQRRTLLIIDIAVPRNFDVTVGQLENVYLFSIDDLSGVASRNRQIREQDIDAGLDIVRENTAEFMEWFEVCDLGPQIGQLTAALARISQNELDRFFVGVRENACCRNTLRPMVNRVVNKIMFCFIKHVNATARELGPKEATRIMDQIVEQARQISADDHQKERTHS